jgi:hypothetical protein
MGLFVVSEVATQLDQHRVLMVSVVSGDDGRPRRGLRPENFAVAQLTNCTGDPPLDRSVARVTEGPSGVYYLDLV